MFAVDHIAAFQRRRQLSTLRPETDRMLPWDLKDDTLHRRTLVRYVLSLKNDDHWRNSLSENCFHSVF